MKTHYKTHGEGPHNCTECGRECSSLRNLRKHYNSHSIIKERRLSVEYKCVFCSKSFLGMKKLITHYKSYGDGPYECKECGIEIENFNNYKEHYKKHTATGGENFQQQKCVVCQQMFLGINKLKLHHKTHGEGPFKCNICGKEKETIKLLRLHVTDHAAYDTVQCEFCEKQMTKKKLRHHLSYHTGMETKT